MTNEKLPIAGFRRQIEEAVENHPVVVITAETGRMRKFLPSIQNVYFLRSDRGLFL